MEFAIKPFGREDASWLIDEHANHYASVEGFDETFGPLVAEILSQYFAHHDPTCEAGWLAHAGETRLGSIFCVRLSQTTAKLRLFYAVPAARGTGIAQALLTECLGFAKDAGYDGMTLWTHESHRAAGGIYRRNGFARTAAKPVHSFGVDLIEETWQIQF